MNNNDIKTQVAASMKKMLFSAPVIERYIENATQRDLEKINNLLEDENEVRKISRRARYIKSANFPTMKIEKGFKEKWDSEIGKKSIIGDGKSLFYCCCWSEIPATMPANDVVVNGTFRVNNYLLTYVVDDVFYQSAIAVGRFRSRLPVC